MFFSRPAGHKYIDREPPDGTDFDQTVITNMVTWTDIDLSSIVPVGTKLVLLAVSINTTPEDGFLQFRKKGVTYWNVGDGIHTFTAGKPNMVNLLIACDSNRKIQYRMNWVTWNSIDIDVKGWFV